MRTFYSSVLLTIGLLCNSGPVGALPLPTIAIDLDRTQADVQTSLSVSLGATIEAAVLYLDDGTNQVFDTVILDVGFNNAGAVLTLTGSPQAGALIDLVIDDGNPNTTDEAVDVFGSNFLQTGDDLASNGVSAPSGFLAGLGGIGIASLGNPFSGLEMEILRLDFIAAMPGNSGIAVFRVPFDPPGIVLASGGVEVPSKLEGATVEVTDQGTVLPEPTTALLLAAGLAVLGYRRIGRAGCRTAQATC